MTSQLRLDQETIVDLKLIAANVHINVHSMISI